MGESLSSNMERWILVSRALQLVLVLITFLLARVGRPGSLSSYGPDQEILWDVTALHFGSSLDSLWLGYILPCYLVIIPALVLPGQHHPVAMDSVLTLVGGVLYIISGSATVNYYKILESSPSYPRGAGLALGSLSIVTGVSMILHFLLAAFNFCQETVKTLEPSNHATEASVKPRLKTIINTSGKDTANNKNKVRARKVYDDGQVDGYEDNGGHDGYANKNNDQQIYVQSAKMFALKS